MSPERLRAMLSKATPGPWRVDGRYVMALKEKWVAELPCGGVLHARVDARNARLIALAPDAIALLADMGEQMEAFGEILTRSRSPIAEIDERMRNLVAPMMARLDALCGDER